MGAEESLKDRGFVVEVGPQEHITIQELVISFLRAVERFRTEDGRSSNVEEQLAHQSLGRSALSEALNWADSIDDYLQQGPRDSDRNRGRLDRLPQDERELVRAFAHVRNAVHHRWWEAVAVRLHSLDEGQVNEWCWGEIPGPRRRVDAKYREGQAAFTSRLQGHRVLDTLDGLARIYWKERRWQIHRSDLEQPGHSVSTSLTLDVQSIP